MKEQMIQYFEKAFGDSENVKCYFAPGRVNLIGEHTDYNGGHVFPCALTIGTYAAVRPNQEGCLRLYSENFASQGVRCLPYENVVYKAEDDWTNYPKGIVWVLGEEGLHMTHGLDIAYFGNIPNGSGLSSSASIEVLTARILTDQFGWELDGIQVSKLAQKSENKFNGVNCGIMDQFAIAMGRKDHATFLDTADLSYQYVPIKMDGVSLVIACSNKKRGLADSKYNERRSECESALAELQKVVSISALGDLTNEQFEQYAGVISNPVWYNRAKHAVSENQRTIQAVAALQAGDLEAFGKLMNASHVSLRDDYEVTGIELDTLVEEAWKQEGVIGSRMTGAGFGGCTVSLVKDEAVPAFIENVGKVYLEKIGYAADFYAVSVGDGPSIL